MGTYYQPKKFLPSDHLIREKLWRKGSKLVNWMPKNVKHGKTIRNKNDLVKYRKGGKLIK